MLADVNRVVGSASSSEEVGLLVFTYNSYTIIVDMCLLVEFLLEFSVFLDRSIAVLGTS